MEELELIKKLNELNEKKQLPKDEFKKIDLDRSMEDIIEFVIHYDNYSKDFHIGIVLDNGYDGYDIYHTDKGFFDFLKIENHEIDLGR